jgi:phospholipid/cholesterol/gamma-HCH transport system permease protein
MTINASIPNLVVDRMSPGVLRARVSGNWREGSTLPSAELVRETLRKEPSVKSVEFDTAGLSGWDSRFVAFISQCAGMVRGRDIQLRYDGLPEGVRRLLRLAHAVPEKTDTHRTVVKASSER